MAVDTPSYLAARAPNERDILHRVWWQLLGLGVISVIVGLLAISATFIATMASVMVFGILLIVAGITEIVHSFVARSGRSFALHVLAAVLYLFAGVFIIEDPVQAAVVLTLFLAASFLVGGVLRVLFSFSLDSPSRSWVLLNGVIDVILGIMIFNRWPEASLWVIGLFVGIDLLFNGWTWIVLGWTLRSHQTSAPAAV
jgi:uncharacterized membrane protein HdeD (DUF308 family)